MADKQKQKRFQGFIENYIENVLDEKPVLPARKLIPDSAADLKKLANGVYGPKIKKMSSNERAEFTTVLQKLIDMLHH